MEFETSVTKVNFARFGAVDLFCPILWRSVSKASWLVFMSFVVRDIIPEDAVLHCPFGTGKIIGEDDCNLVDGEHKDILVVEPERHLIKFFDGHLF